MKITQIVNDYSLDGEKDGYLIKTETDEYTVLICNFQKCCEDWGYLASECDLSRYIGAELISVEVVDKVLNLHTVEDICKYEEDFDAIFVNFNTSEGVFQIVAYNEHNGYYSHEVEVSKNKYIMFEKNI